MYVISVTTAYVMFVYIRKYSNFTHPRKGGPGGKKFGMMDTTTGRHCMIGGVGEQVGCPSLQYTLNLCNMYFYVMC